MKNVKIIFFLVVAAIMSGSLTCMASADSFEPDNSYSNAASITTDGQTQSHSINPAADEDWLMFTIESISDVVIETSGISGDTVLWLYNGQVVELSTDDEGGAGSFSRIQTTLPTGTYYVRVSEFNVKALITEYFVSVLATPRKVLSIYPNSATKGDIFEVTIKGLGTTFFQGSSTITNVWLSKGSMTIDANSFTGLDATTIEASFDIPVNIVAGKWDVHVSNSVDGNLPSFVDGFLVYIYPDLNEDGQVDNTDFALLANHWLEFTVPNVSGMTQAEAQVAFEAISLVVGTISKDYDTNIISGNVISIEPVAGTKVNGGSTVNLLISMGPVVEPAGMVWVAINDSGAGMKDGNGNLIYQGGFTGDMSKYEVTNAQFCQYLNAALVSGDITISGNYVYGANGFNGGADFVGEFYYNLSGSGTSYNGATSGGAARINYTGSSFTVDNGFENHPLTHISWYGATSFASYYGWRLPTQWEWQAVADNDGSYIYGCGKSKNNSIANYYNSMHPHGTTTVGEFGTYGYGIADMAGNVSEWTSSLWSNGRVFLGGCWWDSGDDACKVSLWSPVLPNYMNLGLGFRVCR